MKPKNVKSYLQDPKFLLRNFAVWFGLYLLIFAAQYFSHPAGDYPYVAQLTASFLAGAFIFYTNFFLCETFFIRRRLFYFLCLLILLFIFYGLVYLLLVRNNNPSGKEAALSAPAIYVYLTLYFALLVFFSGFYWSVLFGRRQLQQNTSMQLRLQQMETEKLVAEKQLLQSQINPHFLYNTLNFFYARSLAAAPELADGILTLSAIMQYSLRKEETGDGLVPLEEEVMHIRNVIHIHQLRYEGRLQIRLDIAMDCTSFRILPLVLITLVENVLKHGDLTHEKYPALIRLERGEGENIIFTTFNKKRNGPKEDSTGIGVANSQKRLQLAYGNRFQLTRNDENGFYKVCLVLPEKPE